MERSTIRVPSRMDLTKFPAVLNVRPKGCRRARAGRPNAARHAAYSRARARWQPTRVPEFIPHETGLGLGSLNHVHNPINTELLFPKLPANRTYGGHRGIDAIDPQRTLCDRQAYNRHSFDHLVGARCEPGGYFVTDRPCIPEIDDQLEIGRLLDGNIGGLDTAQHLDHHPCPLTVHLREPGTVCGEAT